MRTDLASKAFDIIDRRKWEILQDAEGDWYIKHDVHNKGDEFHGIIDRIWGQQRKCWEDVVAADKWLTEHEEGSPYVGKF